MIGSMITYDLAQTTHEDRLEKAAQARLINNFKMASSLPQFKKRSWRFTLKKFFFTSFQRSAYSK